MGVKSSPAVENMHSGCPFDAGRASTRRASPASRDKSRCLLRHHLNAFTTGTPFWGKVLGVSIERGFGVLQGSN